ncbi:tyrosine-type recombinase/integrase [Candidatus Rariloculus sp.]|uniref:tyrosine-type recombinase/integrase n=1 Tax=Candidatus Rariloculus sp. TaxID=3101265 RepID=UPI003D12D424
MATRRTQRGSIYQREGSPKFQGKFRDATGQVRRVSLKTADKAEARAKLDKLISNAAPKPDISTTDLAAAYVKGAFVTVAESWLKHYKDTKITTKRKDKATKLVRGRFYEAFGALRQCRNISAITPTEIRKYITDRFNEGARHGTIKIERQYLMAIWDIAVEKEIVSRNIVRAIKLVKPTKEISNRTQFTVDQFAEVLTQVARKSDRQALTVFFWTGARKSELEAAQWEDIITNGGGRSFLKIRASSNKTGTARKVLLTQPALDALDSLRGCSEDSFILPRVGVNHWYHVIRRAAIAAGWDMETESVGVHTLRHSYCSHWANMPGIPLAWVRDWAGHSNIAITDVYVKSDESRMDSVLTGLGY